MKNVPGPYSEHFLDKIGHQEGVLTLKKKRPKEGERVARGNFHERVCETPDHLLRLGFGPTPKHVSGSKNGSFQNFQGPNQILYSKS